MTEVLHHNLVSKCQNLFGPEGNKSTDQHSIVLVFFFTKLKICKVLFQPPPIVDTEVKTVIEFLINL